MARHTPRILLPLVLLLAVPAGAVDRGVPDGAFGLKFEEPAPDEKLGGTVAPPAIDLPLPSLDFEPIESPPGLASRWRVLAAPAVPARLDGVPYTVIALIDDDHRPVRIVMTARPDSCPELQEWFRNALGHKYLERARLTDTYGSDRFAAAVRCAEDGSFLVQYIDVAGYTAYRAWHRDQVADLQAAAREREHRAAIAYADSFTLGNRHKVQGAFDVLLHEPYPGVEAFIPDQPFELNIRQAPEPFESAGVTLSLGPDRVPIEIRAAFDHLSETAFDHIRQSLKEKYGLPYKSTPRHIVHRVNGDFVVLKRLPGTAAEFVVVNADALKARRARQLAAREQDFDEETRGL